MVPISGFTIIRNATRLDFPVVESIRSILPVCEELVVNVGRSDDDTLDLIRSIGDARIRILETEWDLSQGFAMLAHETLRAMRACRFPWGIYIQADEVLHEMGALELRDLVQHVDRDARVEGLLVNYLHFYGDPGTLARQRTWYRREVRCLRLDPALDIRPYRDAQGFRVWPGPRKIRVRPTGAWMFHYGWARPPAALDRKREFNRVVDPGASSSDARLLPWQPFLEPFTGEHPAAVRDWVTARMPKTGERRVGAPAFSVGLPRMYLSQWWEAFTGRVPFEFRNYETL